MHLIDEKPSTLQEVIDNLNEQQFGTTWANAMNHLTVAYAQELNEKHGNVWYKGLLSDEDFNSILMPAHAHGHNSDIFFRLGASITEAKEYFKNPKSIEGRECLDSILYLKNRIKSEGFTSTIALTVINGKLNHLDGVHRIIALSMLLDEGLEYKPVPVFVWDPSR